MTGRLRKDPASGAFAPWPWTVNAEGQGFFYDSKREAVAAVEGMRRQGMRSIDVGCMQINLMHHPDAFASLDQAFDPAANADYGARFLSQLHDKSNSWPRAVEMYHSATPEIGQEYGLKVYAALPSEEHLAGLIPPSALPGLVPPSSLAAAWSATMAPTASRSPFSSMAFRPSPARVIPLPAMAQGGMTPGRGLDSYRAAPIRLAFRSS